MTGNRIIQQIHGNLDAQPADETGGRQDRHRAILRACRGAQVACLLRRQGSLPGPLPRLRRSSGRGIRRSGQMPPATTKIPAGRLSCVVELALGESRTVAFLLGAKYDREAAALLDGYHADPADRCAAEVQALKEDMVQPLKPSAGAHPR
ncbi:MAG: hypothetical protein ACLU9S_03865 [Oscillospiraceae bacterium]